MRLFLVKLFILLTSCSGGHQADLDHFTFEGPEKIEEVSKFALAAEVINNRCINCHSGYHNFWKSYKTEDNWVNEPSPRFGSVIPGDPDGSAIIYRLSKWGTSSEDNMPEAAPSLTEKEYLSLVDWINSIEVK
jgi:hypothetical protein